MTDTARIDVNPAVLEWAREESGYSVQDLARKLKIDDSVYREWENTGGDIPFSVLREISKTLKRQVAMFFLPEVPRKVRRPTDYRNLAVSHRRLTSESWLSVRRVDKFRQLLIEFHGDSYFRTKYAWLSEFQASFGKQTLTRREIAHYLRSLLGFSLTQQINNKTISDSYNKWRSCFEDNLGVYVFQLSMPTQEIQGFSYSDAFPYCIAVNAKYPMSSRIFTMFHELGHILKRQSGLCIPDQVTENELLEFECNTFAGAFLVPDNTVQSTLDKDEIYKRATKLKVSSEVYLRRLKALNLISDEEFFRLLEEIRSSVKPSGFGILSPLEKSIASRGQSLFNSVVGALNDKKISYERASDILGVKISHLMNS